MLKPYHSVSTETEKLSYGDLINVVDDVQGFDKHVLRNSAGGLPSYGYSIGDESKPCVVIDGSIHNNHEWKSAYGLLDMMRVLSNPSLYAEEVDEVQRLKDKYRFYFIPVLSPDSYSKGQRTNDNGIFLDRNFPFNWTPDVAGETPGVGGTAPFSEPETQNLRDVVLNNKTAIYINNHTVGNFDDLMMIRTTRTPKVTQVVEQLVEAVQITYSHTNKDVRYSTLNAGSSSYNWAETQKGALSDTIASIVYEPGFGLPLQTLMSVATYGMFNFISDMDSAFDTDEDLVVEPKKNRFFKDATYYSILRGE